MTQKAENSALSDLLAELERATGNDRQLDCRLHRLIGGDGDADTAPPYTGSVSRAIALLESALPGWKWHLGYGVRGIMPYAALSGVFSAVFRGVQGPPARWNGDLVDAGGAPGGSPYAPGVTQGCKMRCRDPRRPPRGVSPPPVGPPSAPYGGVLGPRARCRGPRRPPTPPTGALRMPLGAGSPPYRGV